MHCLFWIFGGLTSLKRLMLRCLICLNLLYWSSLVHPYWSLIGLIGLYWASFCTCTLTNIVHYSLQRCFCSQKEFSRKYVGSIICSHLLAFCIDISLSCQNVPIYDKLLDHVMWRPWAKQNNFRQHNCQLGTRVILKIWIGFSEHGIPKENVT